MIRLCGVCQRRTRTNIWICAECARQFGLLDDAGRLRPRAEWPAWVRYATSNEKERRRAELEAERRCAPPDELELRGSAEWVYAVGGGRRTTRTV